MPDDKEQPKDEQQEDQGSAAATKPRKTPAPGKSKPAPKKLPPWKVILHNDDVNDMEFVVDSIVMLTPLKEQEAVHRTLEAHTRGQTLLLTTHRERAELYQQQFTSRKLTVTIEPA